jgi:ribosome maturation factor RimP
MLDELRQSLITEGDRLIAELGCYIVDVEIEPSRSAPLFRFFIDTFKGGVAVKQCARASHRLRDHLEASGHGEDFGIEVSSPGVERRVGRAKDFKRFAGREVRVRLRAPIDGKRKFSGTIVSADDAAVTVRVEEGELVLPYPRIARANLTHDFTRLEEG